MKETLEETAKRIYGSDSSKDIEYYAFINGAKWQSERGQKIVPFDAVDIEVFAIKPDEYGKLFAYIGYKVANGNFEFNVVPFTEPQAERMYSEEDMVSFAEFVATYPDKNRNVNGEILHAKSKYDGAERTIDLLKQFKKK
jgi:hypothetical protein